MRRAPSFQLRMMPLRSLLIIASSEDAMIAARKFSAASDKTLCFPRSPADSSALTNAHLLRRLLSNLRLLYSDALSREVGVGEPVLKGISTPCPSSSSHPLHPRPHHLGRLLGPARRRITLAGCPINTGTFIAGMGREIRSIR